MKILITTDCYRPIINGVVTSVVNLANGLEKQGHEVRILTLSNSLRSHKENNVTYLGSIGVGKIYPHARLRIAPASRLIRELIDWRPDVVHSQSEFSTFVPAKRIARKCGAPLVHTYHTVYEDFTHYFSPSVRLGRVVAAVGSRWLLSGTQAVVAPTEKVRSMLQRYHIVSPIVTVPTGLDLDRFTQPMDDEKRNSLRLELGFRDSDCVLVYLGRLAKEKNIEELLALLQNQDDLSAHLLIVGDGPHRNRLENLAAKMGVADRTVFTGMVPPAETATYYRLGDIFVSASRSEAQGLTYIEAMACGLPLLCRQDACLDGVVADGINGFTYASPEEFHRKGLLLLDRKLRAKLGEAAVRTAQEKFSICAFACGVSRVYRSLNGASAVFLAPVLGS